MAMIEISISGYADIPGKIVRLMRDGLLTVSEDPRIVLRIDGDTKPEMSWESDHIRLAWADATVERKGKDCKLHYLEIRDTEILIHLQWMFSIDLDVLVRFV